MLDCWYITYLFNIYYSQAKIETMIYCVCDTSQEWTSVVWTISYVRLSNRNQRTNSDVLIVRERRRHVPIFSTLRCLHIHTSYWDLLFIHSLSLKQSKRVYLDNCSCSWLSSQVSGGEKKERASQGKSKKTLFLFFFPYVWQCSMHVCVCV